MAVGLPEVTWVKGKDNVLHDGVHCPFGNILGKGGEFHGGFRLFPGAFPVFLRDVCPFAGEFSQVL